MSTFNKALRFAAYGALALVAQTAWAQTEKPNIIMIMADDIGEMNISAYHRGVMGGSTPNIDKIAAEGALFTDYYAQQSCTAGRAAFITGQVPFRTGLLKVGLPGSDKGLQPGDPTIAEMLKEQGYATAQVGKNHLGDRNEFLPTVHGFDMFFGNLYHLNAEEEPEDPDYPKDPKFKEAFGPRGVLDCKATESDAGETDPRFGAYGKQTCTDTGPLTIERMKTVEKELLERSLGFIDQSVKDDKPFFLWHNPTRMHVWTHLSDEWKDKSGYGIYADGMMELDWVVGEIMAKLDTLGIADNTIVVFTSDNGAEVVTWPDGGMTAFHGEKGTTWEGGTRVPALVRWPGVIKPGTIINDITSHEDWMPTFLAAAGDTTLKEDLLQGRKAGDKTFRKYLDGYNQMPFFKGEVAEGPRKEFIYFDDNGNLNALRYGEWKLHFSWLEGNFATGQLKTANVPLVVNLRRDPFERAPFESGFYLRFQAEKLFTIVPAQATVAKFINSFEEYPQSQPSASFNLSTVLEKLSTTSSQ